MRTYTIIFTLILNFGSLGSYFVYAADLSFAQQMLALKDLCLAIGLLLVLPSVLGRLVRGRLEEIDWIILLAIVVNLLSFVISDAPVGDRIINFRRHITFLVVVLIFREYGTGFRSEVSFLQLLKPILLALWTFGVVEFFMPDSFWQDGVGITAYWDALSVDPFGTPTIGENGRFYTWDLYALFGAVRRMVSFYFEPTTLAAFFVACFCISLLGGKRERIWTVSIALFGMLTISKFFVLAIPLSVGIYVFRDHLHPRLFLGFIFGCIAMSVIVTALGIEAGALAHLKGISSLVEIVMQEKWLGLGLGAGGNYADAEVEGADIGLESGFGNVAAQLGLMSLVYVFLLNSLYTELLARYRTSRDPRYAAAVGALMCWTLSFFLSASSLGLSGNAFIFILIGSVLHKRRRAPVPAVADVPPIGTANP